MNNAGTHDSLTLSVAFPPCELDLHDYLHVEFGFAFGSCQLQRIAIIVK